MAEPTTTAAEEMDASVMNFFHTDNEEEAPAEKANELEPVDETTGTDAATGATSGANEDAADAADAGDAGDAGDDDYDVVQKDETGSTKDSDDSDNDQNGGDGLQMDLMGIMQKYEAQLATERDDSRRIEQELGEQIQELNESIFALEDELARKDRDIDQLQKNAKTADIESQHLTALQRDYDKLERDHNDLKQKYEEMKSKNYEHKIRELENEIFKLNQMNKNLEGEKSRLTQDVELLNTKLVDIREAKNKADGMLATYKQENERLNGKLESLSAMEKEFTNFKRNYDLLGQYAKQQATVINQLSKMAPNIAHLAETFESVKMSEKQIESIGVGTENGAFYNHLGKLSNASDILASANMADNLAREAEMEDELDQYKEKLENMQNEMGKKSNQIEVLQQELRALTQQDGLLANYKVLESQYGLLNKQLISMEKSITSLTSEITERDRLIKAIVKDKYETVNVLANQLDFLRNLIKEHNLTIDLVPEETETGGLFSYLTSWMTAGGGDEEDPTTDPGME